MISHQICEYPWSNRDLFQYVEDCHIYLPILTFLMTLNVVFAGLVFIYAVSEFFKSSRKNIPIVSMCNEFLFVLSWISCLAANETFASGNYGINLLFGIAKGGFYLTIHLFTLRNAEVLLVMDKINLKRDPSLIVVQFFMTRVVLFLSIPIESLAVTLPIRFPEFPMVNTILYVQLVLGTLTSPFAWFYLHKLRKNLSEMTTSREVYGPIEKKLAKLLIVSISQWVLGIIPTICLLYIPLLHQNTYIPYCFIMFILHISQCRCLYATSADSINSCKEKESVQMVASPSSHQSTLDISLSGDTGNDRCRPLFNPFSTTPIKENPDVVPETEEQREDSGKVVPETEEQREHSGKGISRLEGERFHEDDEFVVF